MPAGRGRSRAHRQAAIRRRRAFVIVFVVLLMILGVVLLFGSTTKPKAAPASPTPGKKGSHTPAAGAKMPPVWLAWMPGGFAPSLRQNVASLPGVLKAVVVAGDTRWMSRSTDAAGNVVDSPAPPYEIPIDAFAVDGSSYAPFLPQAYRAVVTNALDNGRAVLGTTSAKVRRLGIGGRLIFGSNSVTVGAVVPDDVASWSEILVSRTVGARLGIVDDRYLLAQMSGSLTDSSFLALIHPLLTAGIPVRVTAPGSVRYVRVSSGSAPPVVLKAVFGEFAAYPDPSDPISIKIDPSWISAHLATQTVPLLGQETCNKAFFPALIGAMQELQSKGLSSLVHSNAGCYNPELLASKTTAPPAFHAYGAAIDINAPENAFGSTPTQDPRLVAVMKHWGFNWGGDFLVPDGMHFEYLNPPPRN
jgi:hypothetical protein